jgi:hypothetical protein
MHARRRALYSITPLQFKCLQVISHNLNNENVLIVIGVVATHLEIEPFHQGLQLQWRRCVEFCQGVFSQVLKTHSSSLVSL